LNVEVREARRSDKEPLMSFIRYVWGGHDYIPYVWDDWLKDRDSKMFVVLADGRQVGMGRVCFLEDGSAWLEGGRVHPEFRGMGLATALAERAMRVAADRGIGIFRLASGSWNKQAHRHIARIGFKEASRMSVYVPPDGIRSGGGRSVRKVARGDLARVMSVIRHSREFALGSGVMWDTFTAKALTRKVVADALDAGFVYTAGGALAIAKHGGEREEAWKQVCFLTGEASGAVRLVRYVFGRKGKADRCLVYLPQGSRLIGALRKAGMKRDYSLILFERRAANG